MRAMPVAEFIERSRACGASRVIVSWQEEWDVTDARGYGPVRRARLLAYAGGEVIAADVPGDQIDRDELLGRLRSSGLPVELVVRSRA
jgi:hypothetical protein